MTLGDDLENMSLNGGKRTARDPVAEAIKSGKAPTVGDVKKSLRVRASPSVTFVFVPTVFSDDDEDPHSSYHSYGRVASYVSAGL